MVLDTENFSTPGRDAEGWIRFEADNRLTVREIDYTIGSPTTADALNSQVALVREGLSLRPESQIALRRTDSEVADQPDYLPITVVFEAYSPRIAL